jgi:hypothetical protein
MTKVWQKLGEGMAPSAAPLEQQSVGANVLDAMIAANAVVVRPYSALAQDIPEAAYGARKSSVVTAPDALMYYCWQQLRGELERAMKKVRVALHCVQFSLCFFAACL